jgi:hypothetical protein
MIDATIGEHLPRKVGPEIFFALWLLSTQGFRPYASHKARTILCYEIDSSSPGQVTERATIRCPQIAQAINAAVDYPSEAMRHLAHNRCSRVGRGLRSKSFR